MMTFYYLKSWWWESLFKELAVGEDRREDLSHSMTFGDQGKDPLLDKGMDLWLPLNVSCASVQHYRAKMRPIGA